MFLIEAASDINTANNKIDYWQEISISHFILNYIQQISIVFESNMNERCSGLFVCLFFIHLVIDIFAELYLLHILLTEVCGNYWLRC